MNRPREITARRLILLVWIGGLAALAIFSGFLKASGADMRDLGDLAFRFVRGMLLLSVALFILVKRAEKKERKRSAD